MKNILLISAVIVVLIISFSIRVIPAYDVILGGETVNFASVDDYAYLYYIDDILANWPSHSETTSMRNFPEGMSTDRTRVPYSYFLASIAKAIPAPPEKVVVWIPPALAILAILAIFFTARALFGNVVAIIAITLLSVMPGEFMSRTILGSIDQHCMEMFLSAITIMLFVFMLQRNKVATALCGISLSLYMMTWEGAPLFIIVFVATIFIMWLKGNPPILHTLICFVTAAAILFISNFGTITQYVALAGASGLMVFFYVTRNIPKKVILLAAAGVVTFVLAYIIFPNHTVEMLSYIRVMFMWHFGSATAEEAPLLITGNDFTLSQAWNYFAGSFYFFLIALGMIIYRKEHPFIIVWSIIMLLNTLAMRRSAYYFVVPIVILSGYLCMALIEAFATWKDSKRKKRTSPGTVLLILGLMSFMSIIQMAQQIRDLPGSIRAGTISPGWREAVTWLKNNPAPDHGVLSWWDYGYWIIREGKSPVYSDPGGGNRRYCGYALTTDNMSDVLESMKTMKVKYIVIDNLMATMKNYSMVQHAAGKATDYQEPQRMYYDRRTGQYQQALLYYPSYYKELAVRLYNYDGAAVSSPGSPTFKYAEVDGVREIIEIRDFPDYDTAMQYAASQTNCVVAGIDPFLSPIAMGDITAYFKPVFYSRSATNFGNKVTPEVKIFEVVYDQESL